jgi:hypothetical protein
VDKTPRILTWALDGSEWSAPRLGRFAPRKEPPVIYWTGDWVGPRVVHRPATFLVVSAHLLEK